MRQLFFIFFLLIFIVGGITFFFTLFQVDRREKQLEAQIRSEANIHLKELSQQWIKLEGNLPSFTRTLNEYKIAHQLTNLTVYDINTETFLPPLTFTSYPPIQSLISDTLNTSKQAEKFDFIINEPTYFSSIPLNRNNEKQGVVLMALSSGHINSNLALIWQQNALYAFVLIIFLTALALVMMKSVVFKPVRELAKSIELARIGNIDDDLGKSNQPAFFKPLINEIGKIKKNLITARLSAMEEARLRIEKIDSPWTARRLQEFVKEILQGRMFIVVSNREPYVHTKTDGAISYFQPASGMVTALEPIMQACGGKWVAYGSGDADKETVDIHDSLMVPPDEPVYSLRRVWLNKEQEKGFYNGFSNEGLWALCHIAHTRPEFRADDWQKYKEVNHLFSEVILKEIKGVHKPIVLVQDFHLALLPRMIKKYRPDCQIAIFWHIPWPNPESFSICPWKKELLDGLLGADLLGFHTQLHCNNFMETVGKELEALLDTERFTISRFEHHSYVRAFPISIAFSNNEHKQTPQELTQLRKHLSEKLNIKSKYIGLGVDRLDYTKGILERLKAVEIFLKQNPTYKEQFTFIQIGAPSRSDIKKYQQFVLEVQNEIDRINNTFKTRQWKPIVYLKQHFDHERITEFYQIADICLVTSLHDGMNLVSKEYIAARSDEKGVLILSEFAGSSRELKDSLIVNPYNAKQTAEAIKKGLEMHPAEQERRMKRMRSAIKNYNIYRWSADLLKAIVTLED